jgi:hypothetical protein
MGSQMKCEPVQQQFPLPTMTTNNDTPKHTKNMNDFHKRRAPIMPKMAAARFDPLTNKIRIECGNAMI